MSLRLLGLLGSLITLLLTGCGGGGGGGSSTSTAPSGVSVSYVTPSSVTPDVLWQVSRSGEATFLNLGQGGFAVKLGAGQSWRGYDLGNQGNPSDPNGLVLEPDLTFVSASDALVTTEHGITRFDFANDGFGVLANQPAGVWKVHPDSKRLYVLRQTIDYKTISNNDDTVALVLYYCDNYLSGNPTWNPLPLPVPAYNARRFKASLHFTSDGSIYVAHYYGLYRSVNGGINWQAVPLVPNQVGSLSWSGVEVFVSKAGSIFAITPDASFVSRDDGASYTAIYPDNSVALRDLMPNMVQSWDDELIYFRSGSLLTSADEGQSWQPLGDLTPFGSTAGEVEYLHHTATENIIDIRWWGAFITPPDLSRLENIPVFAGATTVIPGNRTGLGAGAFPFTDGQGRAGYIGRWGTGVARHFDGESLWQLDSFLPALNYLDKRSNGVFILAGGEGLRQSSDAGASWSAAVPLPTDHGNNDALVDDIFELPDGTLYMSARSRASCVSRPHLTSSDGGASWSFQADTRTIVGAPNPNYNRVEVYSVDNNGILFGMGVVAEFLPGTNLAQCTVSASVPVRSDDSGATWVAKPTILLPHLVNSSNTLFHFDNGLAKVELLAWPQGASSWRSWGLIKRDGATLAFDLNGEINSHTIPYMDAADRLTLGFDYRVLQSSALP